MDVTVDISEIKRPMWKKFERKTFRKKIVYFKFLSILRLTSQIDDLI